jgi:hypothetical protein
MISWLSGRIPSEAQLQDEDPLLDGTLGVDVGDVMDEKVPAANLEFESLLHEAAQVLATTYRSE